MAKNTKGINRLARALDDRMRGHSEIPDALDFATIQKDYSLLADNFPIPILLKDYMVCSSTSLSAGDRVLIAWIAEEAVVIDKIKKAKKQFGDVSRTI